jgi:hypothetical protein
VVSRPYTIRASLCAVAVIALGAPSLARIRRKKAPSIEGLWAASRKACATRCLHGAGLDEQHLKTVPAEGGTSSGT